MKIKKRKKYTLKKVYFNTCVYANMINKQGVYKDSKPLKKERYNKWHGIFTKVEE